MPQSSLTAWLKKPVAVIQPSRNNASSEDDINALPKPLEPQQQLPTPPPSSAEDGKRRNAEVGSQPADRVARLMTSKLTTSRPTLPPNVDLRPCTKADIPAFKRLNSLLLSVPYPDSFYREILEDAPTSNITLLALWHDDPSQIGNEKGRLVGAIRCRILAHPPDAGPKAGAEKPMLYLSTLVLLSPYRGHGIAADMLRRLTVRAVEADGIGSVGAHVWEKNVEGLEWYAKRGFKVVSKEEGYYRKLKPGGAVVVRRDVRIGDLMGD